MHQERAGVGLSHYHQCGAAALQAAGVGTDYWLGGNTRRGRGVPLAGACCGNTSKAHTGAAGKGRQRTLYSTVTCPVPLSSQVPSSFRRYTLTRCESMAGPQLGPCSRPLPWCCRGTAPRLGSLRGSVSKLAQPGIQSHVFLKGPRPVAGAHQLKHGAGQSPLVRSQHSQRWLSALHAPLAQDELSSSRL